VNIEWDSISLQSLPDTYIRSAINEGCDYLTYNIEPKDLELCAARDIPADIVKVARKLGEKWDNLEVFGELADLIEVFHFPLCELTANDGESEQTKAAVDLYAEYFWNR